MIVASLTRKQCSINTGVTADLGKVGAAAAVSTASAAPVKGPGCGRIRIDTGGGNDTGTGGTTETAAEAGSTAGGTTAAINSGGTTDLGKYCQCSPCESALVGPQQNQYWQRQ